MALLQIKTNNPNLSFILVKNPNTGMVLRRYRQGTIFGFYSENKNNTEYNLYFKDGDDEVSFKKEQDEFEYNDYKRYNSPLFIQGAVNEFFRHLTNVDKVDENDSVGFENEIFINQMYMFNPKYIDLLNKYYGDTFTITYTELNKNNYSLSVKTNKASLKDTVNLLYIISVFYYCTNDKNVWIEEEEIARYVKILNNIDSPYFIKYVIKSRIIRSVNKFNSVKKDLDLTKKHGTFDILFGDTGYQRADYIKNLIGNDDNIEIIDLGCNNMANYGFSLLKKLNKNNTYYHAIDIDTEEIEYIKRKADNNGYGNLITYNNINDLIENKPTQLFNVILSEVFEHITLEEDTQIINNILSNLNVNKMIITTPNKEFNVNYLFEDDDKRLDEHIFEMNKKDFVDYFDNIMKPFEDKYVYEFINIGDIVNGISATQAVVIRKK